MSITKESIVPPQHLHSFLQTSAVYLGLRSRNGRQAGGLRTGSPGPIRCGTLSHANAQDCLNAWAASFSEKA